MVLEKGFARGLLMIPTTEESPNAESKIESPESGDYNLHHSARKRNLSENREYSWVSTKTGNNLPSVRTQLAKSCKPEDRTGGESLRAESPV